MNNRTRPMKTSEAARYVEILKKASEREAAYAAMAAIAIGTGARISEVLSLRTLDVLEPTGKLKDQIRRKVKKKRNAIVYRDAYFIDPMLRKIVERYVGSPRRASLYLPGNANFFAAGISGKAIPYYKAWRHNRRFLGAAGLPMTGLAFHGLRKTFLSKVYEKIYADTGDMLKALTFVQKLAGHESLNTTIIYLDITPVDEANTVRETLAAITGDPEVLENQAK